MRDGTIRMTWSDALLRDPPPLPPELTFDRIEGMLLGLAVGDALGNTTEGHPTPRLWADAAIAGMITHYDFTSHAVCVAFMRLLWDALCLPSP